MLMKRILYFTGSIDKSSWSGEDFEPLLNGVWQDIVIHAMHQQRCENFVQMAALIAKTLVRDAVKLRT